MEVETFNREIRERQVHRFEGAFQSCELAALFDVRTFDALIAENVIPSAYFDVVSGGQPKRLSRADGVTAATAVTDGLRSGATIRVSDIQRFNPTLGEFSRDIARTFAARAQINVYLTPPRAHGFAPHFDTTDIFIVQCAGEKMWEVFGNYDHKLDLPFLETEWEPDRYRPSSEPANFSLRAGDVLYLPRGVMHQAYCGEQPSLHLTVSIAPTTLFDLLSQEVRRFAVENIDLRKRAHWSLNSLENDAPRVDHSLRELLVVLADRLDAKSLLAAERQSLEPGPNPDGLEATLRELTSDGGHQQ